MSKLTLFRHAQASFMAEDYDNLSKKGIEQSRQLGAHLASIGAGFDQVYIGPLKRHQQTFDEVQKAYEAANLPLPIPAYLPTLAEHHGPENLKMMRSVLHEVNPKVVEWEASSIAALNDPKKKKYYELKIFTWFMDAWANGKFEKYQTEEFQTWRNFRISTRQALDKMMSDAPSGSNVAAFTSGGVVASITGFAYDLPSESMVIDMNSIVRNTSYSEYLFSGEKISLMSFNNIDHLKGEEFITFV